MIYSAPGINESDEPEGILQDHSPHLHDVDSFNSEESNPEATTQEDFSGLRASYLFEPRTEVPKKDPLREIIDRLMGLVDPTAGGGPDRLAHQLPRSSDGKIIDGFWEKGSAKISLMFTGPEYFRYTIDRYIGGVIETKSGLAFYKELYDTTIPSGFPLINGHFTIFVTQDGASSGETNIGTIFGISFGVDGLKGTVDGLFEVNTNAGRFEAGALWGTQIGSVYKGDGVTWGVQKATNDQYAAQQTPEGHRKRLP